MRRSPVALATRGSRDSRQATGQREPGSPPTGLLVANLQQGLIILEANRKKMTAVKDFEDILKKTASGEEVILLVRQETERNSQDFIATVKLR